jgi:hypothetical protein
MSLAHAANPARHALAARKDDLYETPPEAVEALMRVEQLPHHIWEPACGPGSIVGILRATGHRSTPPISTTGDVRIPNLVSTS